MVSELPLAKRQRTDGEAASGANALNYKTKLCNKFNTPIGCSYGEYCLFAHGQEELRKYGQQTPATLPSYYPQPAPYNPPAQQYTTQQYTQPVQQYSQPVQQYTQPAQQYAQPSPQPYGSATGSAQPYSPGYSPPPQQEIYSPRAIAAAEDAMKETSLRIEIDSSLAGPIIGKGGERVKQIYRQTRVKVSVKDHETDPSKKWMEMVGSFQGIDNARRMVEGFALGSQQKVAIALGTHNYKTQLCKNFTEKGACSYGDRCLFAHGAHELRTSAANAAAASVAAAAAAAVAPVPQVGYATPVPQVEE